MANQKYYTQITQYGLDLINTHTLSGEAFITDDWYIALGTGALIPSKGTTALINKIYDKNSAGYLGILIGNDADIGRYAEIQVSDALQGNIITELGLFDGSNNLILCANTFMDFTKNFEQGLYKKFRVRLSLNAIPSDLEVITISPPSNYPTITQVNVLLGDYQPLDEKDKANGYAGLDANKKILLSELPSLLTKFAVNSGAVDSNGEANYLSFLNSIITLASGTNLTNASGSAITVNSALTYTNTATSGVLWLYVNSTGTTLSAVSSLYVQPTQPTPSTSAIWLDTSIEPLVAKYYNGTAWSVFDGVVVGRYLVSASTIIKVTSLDFNCNFYDIKDRVVYSFGTVASTIYLKPNRQHDVTFSGASTIYLPTNLPPKLKFQFELDVVVTSASPTISYNVAPTWAFSTAPSFSSTTAVYRLTFETKDGGTSYKGYWSQLGT